MQPDDILKNLTPEIYRRFKTAIEIGKWPDGTMLSEAQRDTCMQAVIAYEHAYIPETERTGYLPKKKQKTCHSEDDSDALKWQNQGDRS